MKLSAAFLCLALCLSLGACTTPAIILTSPEDAVRHEGSQLVLPSRLGEFVRGEVNAADASLADISAQYTRNHLRDRLNGTLFIYPASPPGASFQEAFSVVKSDIEKYTPQAELVDEAALSMVLQGIECKLLTASYRFMEKVMWVDIEFQTTATLVDFGDWHVLFRLTSPADSAERSQAELYGIHQAFAEANGGHLVYDKND